jgi:hypothetical protein
MIININCLRYHSIVSYFNNSIDLTLKLHGVDGDDVCLAFTGVNVELTGIVTVKKFRGLSGLYK